MTGLVGVVASLLFALEFLIPNITAVKTLSMESYLILAAWGMLGLIAFLRTFKMDSERRLRRSTVAWIVLLSLIIFTSSVWMHQSASKSTEESIDPIRNHYSEKIESEDIDQTAEETVENVSVDGIHVLIAEDQEMNAEVLTDLLEMEEISSERAPL